MTKVINFISHIIRTQKKWRRNPLLLTLLFDPSTSAESVTLVVADISALSLMWTTGPNSMCPWHTRKEFIKREWQLTMDSNGNTNLKNVHIMCPHPCNPYSCVVNESPSEFQWIRPSYFSLSVRERRVSWCNISSHSRKCKHICEWKEW